MNSSGRFAPSSFRGYSVLIGALRAEFVPRVLGTRLVFLTPRAFFPYLSAEYPKGSEGTHDRSDDRHRARPLRRVRRAAVSWGLQWWTDVVQFLKGGAPILALFIGLIAFFVGVADMKDKAEAKKEEEEEKKESAKGEKPAT